MRINLNLHHSKGVDLHKGNPVTRFFSELQSKIVKLVSYIFSKKKTVASDNRVRHIEQVDSKKDILNNQHINLDSENTIIYNKKTNQYTYICKAPSIKNLVISGGGAKGVILPGVIKAFEKCEPGSNSFRDQLENLAGSSIGAVTAGLLATGMSADNLVKATGSIEFKSLLGKGLGPIRKDGKPLLDFIRKSIKESISDHLKEISGSTDLNNLNVKQMVLSHLKKSHKEYKEDQVKNLVIAIESILTELKKDDHVCITFSMLRSLHELDSKIFKDLTVTATCREKGETFYFNAIQTPNLDIAIACRASASLPLILSPVRIDRQFLSPGYDTILPKKSALTFSDGGFLDNIPVEAMHDKQEGITNKGEHGQNLQTLALVFDETRRTEDMQSPFLNVKTKKHALYNSSSLKDRIIRDIFAKLFGKIKTKKRNTLSKERGLEEIRQRYTQRNIPLLVSIKTTDFKKAKRFEQEYRQKGFQLGEEYLKIHEDELIARSFDYLDDLLKYVPEETKQKMHAEISNFQQETRPL